MQNPSAPPFSPQMPAYQAPPPRVPLCATCADSGLLIEKRGTALYACGFATVAIPCPDCKHGFDAEQDHKMAAAGGAA